LESRENVNVILSQGNKTPLYSLLSAGSRTGLYERGRIEKYKNPPVSPSTKYGLTVNSSPRAGQALHPFTSREKKIRKGRLS
jgi:hypothetical protein